MLMNIIVRWRRSDLSPCGQIVSKHALETEPGKTPAVHLLAREHRIPIPWIWKFSQNGRAFISIKDNNKNNQNRTQVEGTSTTYRTLLVWKSLDDEGDNLGSETADDYLLEVSETEQLLRDSCTRSVTNEERKTTWSSYKLPRVSTILVIVDY